MNKVISRAVIILTLCAVNLLSIEEDKGCTFDENQVFCKKVSDKFLSHGGNKKMHIMYIVQSDLRNLTKEDFADFKYVTTVSIHQGLFDFSKQNNLFGSLKGLEELRIENSDATEDVKATFSTNYNIVNLILTGNKISALQIDFFGHLKYIEKIDLSNNLIEFLEIGIFDGLPSLTQLNLSTNKLGYKFDNGFLTLSNSQCVVCKTKSIHGTCTQEDIIKCRENEHIDQLWWKSHSFDLVLENNPVCNLITEDVPVDTQGREIENIDDNEINPCTVYETGSCFKHESRRMFLLDVCAVQNYIIPKIKETEMTIAASFHYKTQEDDQQSNEIVLSSRQISVIAGAILFGCIIGGFAVASCSKLKKKKSQPSNHLYELVSNEDTSPYTVDFSDDKTSSNDPLHTAAALGHLNEVKDLISKGQKSSTANEYGDTPLHLAAQGNHKEIVEFLLKQDVDVNPQNNAQDTPLIIAARKNHLSTVRVFLAQGGDCSCCDSSGNTPLHLAVTNGNYDMVASILEKMTSTEEIDKEGRTVLFAAAVASHTDIVDLLLHHKANVHAVALDGRTPLHIASWNGNNHIVKLLLQKKADVNRKDKKGYTPVHNASRKGHVDVLKLLLQCEGVDVNAANEDKNTPLHQAANGGHVTIIKLLLDNGADPKRVNKNMKTPSDVAFEGGHEDCVALLKLS